MSANDVDRGRLSLAKLQHRIDDAERQVGDAGRSAPRAALYDATGGITQAEHEALAEGIIIVVLATAVDPGELPLRSLYQQDGGSRQILPPIARLPAELAERFRLDGSIGKHASAALYFLPHARAARGSLVVDFARNREGFILTPELPTDCLANVNDTGTSTVVDSATLARVIRREYPGFELLDYTALGKTEP